MYVQQLRIDHLPKIPQDQPIPALHVDENVSLLPVAQIMRQLLAGVVGQLPRILPAAFADTSGSPPFQIMVPLSCLPQSY